MVTRSNPYQIIETVGGLPFGPFAGSGLCLVLLLKPLLGQFFVFFAVPFPAVRIWSQRLKISTSIC
jgi:hypothetical protein